MAYKFIIYEESGALATLTFNRPEVRNALNYAIISEALEAIIRFEDGPARVLIVTGAGDRAFVSGADINELKERDTLRSLGKVAAERRVLAERLEITPKPSIAAINGFCTGGGLELAMACTMRVAADSSRLGQPEINLGIIPGNGGTQRLPRMVGIGRAMEMILTGDLIDAQEACRIGLVNKVVPAAQLMPAARELAMKLASKAPVALAMAKDAVNRSLSTSLTEGLQIEALNFAICCGTEDKKEGIAAFLDKRPATFKGV